MKVFLRHENDLDGTLLADLPFMEALKLPETLKDFAFCHAENPELEFKLGLWQQLMIDSDSEVYLEIGYGDA